MAVSHVRLRGRAALFMGKVGGDEIGGQGVYDDEQGETVQTAVVTDR